MSHENDPLDADYQADTWVDLPQVATTATLREVIDSLNVLTDHVNYQAKRIIGIED